MNNPADLVTRGISARELIVSKLWLNGPTFLLDNIEVGYNSKGCSDSDECGEDLMSVACAGMDEAQTSVLPHHILSSIAT